MAGWPNKPIDRPNKFKTEVLVAHLVRDPDGL